MTAVSAPLAEAQRWLLLVHQLPPRPSYFRVKIWRRLQALGAVAVKPSVYTLPAGDQFQEDFQWLSKEIVAGGGEAMVCEARLIDGLSDDEARLLFDRARDADYETLAVEVRTLIDRRSDVPPATPAQVARLRRRYEQIVGIDFFAADGRLVAQRLLQRLEEGLKELPPSQELEDGVNADLVGKVWVTRRGVYVDRIACAWAVKRFVDPNAIFKFVDPQGYSPGPGEVRFDMYEGEVTHEGDKCSLEVLIDRAGLSHDPALRIIAEIVHDIDLKDGKFGREETAGIAHLLKGVCAPERSDDQRISRASSIFNDLYASFGGEGQ